MEASVLGVVLLLLAVWGGKFVYANAAWSHAFSLREETVAWSIISYGLAASVLPVWLLLAPRDYLSTFMKLGTIFALAVGIFLVLPDLKMPALSRFVDGSGPVVAGKVFPFCFITIACGAISGFHTLISSGTTPKLITRESYARPIGYGAMCLESLVAIMALIAACTLEPGVYLGMNVKGEPAAVVQKVTQAGYELSTGQMQNLAQTVGEKTLFNRTAGAATLAVGMAQIFGGVTRQHWLDLWYHFAIMFEALFILTTLDAGTRVGRYLLQDVLGNFWKPLGQTGNLSANVLASVLMVMAWGYFLIQGVRDPLGGINSLWPLFGIANQLLAAIALCLATTIILKMSLQTNASIPAPEATLNSGFLAYPRSHSPTNPLSSRPAVALVTLVPLAWLLAVTMTAGVQKIWHSDPRIGFLAKAKSLDQELPDLEAAATAAKATLDPKAIDAAMLAQHANRVLHFNNLLDAVVAGVFLVLVAAITLLSAREWLLLLARRKLAVLRETEPVWLPDYAIAEAKPLHAASLLALAFALAKELSGEAHLERAQQLAQLSDTSDRSDLSDKSQLYLEATEKRFQCVRRCC